MYPATQPVQLHIIPKAMATLHSGKSMEYAAHSVLRVQHKTVQTLILLFTTDMGLIINAGELNSHMVL